MTQDYSFQRAAKKNTLRLLKPLRPLPFNVSGNLKRELLKSNLVDPELASI